MTFLVFTTPAFAVVDKWTPAGFNWSSLETGSPDTWKGLYQNLSNPSVAVSKEVMAMGVTHTADDGTTALVIPFAVGVAWQVTQLALTGASLASTISTCIQNEGNPTSIFYCAVGLVGTLVSKCSNVFKSFRFLGTFGGSRTQSTSSTCNVQCFENHRVKLKILTLGS